MTYRADLVRGNIANTPELRYLDNGTAVVSFRVIENPSVRNPETQQWERGTEKVTHRVQAWRQLAVNVTNSFQVGDPVVVSGTLKVDAYVDANGEARPGVTINADLVAPDLRLVEISVRRGERAGRDVRAVEEAAGVAAPAAAGAGSDWPTVVAPGQPRG